MADFVLTCISYQLAEAFFNAKWELDAFVLEKNVQFFMLRFMAATVQAPYRCPLFQWGRGPR
jgi:hypothetical protein